MGLRGDARDWRALALEMQADGLSGDNINKMMASFGNDTLTCRQATKMYRAAIDKHRKELEQQEIKAEKEALIPRPDAFGNWS